MTTQEQAFNLILHVPEDINERYNGALTQLQPGAGTLVGNENKLQQMTDALENIETPNVLLLGEQGVGKTAIVEELIHRKLSTETPLIVVTLAVETLGELDENIMVGRMRTLQDDMLKVDEYTAQQIGHHNYRMVLFIDEVHKLHAYGLSNESSGAMNALKEGLARGKFPLIAATTDYEYRKNIATDPAFERRLHNIVLEQPGKETTISILKRRVDSYRARGYKFNDIPEEIYGQIYDLSDAYIRNQVNPAKSLAILESLVGYSISRKADINYDALKTVFDSEGYNIEVNVSPSYVNDIIRDQVKGQPLAVSTITDVINMTFYTKRDVKRPIATIFAVGTTGTGKALRNDEWILTLVDNQPTFQRNGDLKPGTLVFNRHGKPVPIASVHPQGKLDQYKVMLQDGRSLITNNEHLFSGYWRDSDEMVTETVDTIMKSEQPFFIPSAEPVKLPEQPFDTNLYAHGQSATFDYDDRYLMGSVSQRQTMLQGILDTVGHVNGDEMTITHYDKSKLAHLRRLMNMQGMHADLVKTPIDNLYGLVIRKSKRIQIVAVQPMHNQFDMTCIYLDDPEHLYLAGEDMIVTHNTQTAKALAQAFYGRPDAMVVLNGGDYSSEGDKLDALHRIGDAVAVNKQQLILLDEIEKSHRNVQMAYMRMIDEGLVTDSLGIERSVNNTIIMATSNLGAKMFEDLKNTLKLDIQPDSNELTEAMIMQWQNKVDDIRKGLEAGDDGYNNGIKPEFLDRFSLFVPYMPLSKQTKAEIAMKQLLKFQAEEAELGFKVVFPNVQTEDHWQEVFGTDNVHYRDVNEVAVMVAEDIISQESGSAGARAITRFIDTHVKVKLGNEIARIIENGQDAHDMLYLVETNGNASSDSNEHGTADVQVTGMTELELQRRLNSQSLNERGIRSHTTIERTPRYTRTTNRS
jgi:ATPases with chaperone activity, ATP-binding subunit